MMQSLLLPSMTAFLLVLSPGPANLSLASFGVAYGFRRSLPYLAGILTGTIAVLIMVSLGVTTVLLSEAVVVQVLKALAVAYISYLAWKIATAPIAMRSSGAMSVPSIWPGLGLALANPKAFAALGAVYTGQMIFEDDVVLDMVIKFLALALAIVVSGILWLSFGAVFSRVLSHPRIGRLVNVSFALLLVFSVMPAVIA